MQIIAFVLLQLSKSKSHFMALSMDNKVYSWGVGPNGELGLGKHVTSADTPCLVESLRNYSIHKIASANGFNVFVTKNGLLLTCGSRRSNCLAHKTNEDLFEPKLVNSLIKVNIFDVSCGGDHVVAISQDGLAYAWGSNEYGKLGIQDLCPIVAEPVRVPVPDNVKFKKVFCGSDATALIDYLGNVWVCGNNGYNKLSLNRVTIFGSNLISFSSYLQRSNLPSKSKTCHISFGPKHTLFFQENSKILAAGCNENGQLGVQHTKPVMRATCCSIPRHHKIKVSFPVYCHCPSNCPLSCPFPVHCCRFQLFSCTNSQPYFLLGYPNCEAHRR